MAEIRYIKAKPSNGDLIHAVVERDGEMQWQQGSPNGFSSWVWTGAICGVRGRDGWGSGGMRVSMSPGNEPVEFDSVTPEPAVDGWDGSKVNKVCPKCLSRVRRARKPTTFEALPVSAVRASTVSKEGT